MAIPFLSDISGKSASFAGDVTLNTGTAKKLSILASTHDTNTANTSTLELGFGHSGGTGVGNIVLTEDANNSFGADMTFGVPHNNGSGGSSTRTALTLDGGTLNATFAGTVTANGTTLTGATDISGKVSKTGDTMTGDLTITHGNTPKLEIIDTTNDVDFAIKAANSYVTLEADSDNDANSTRIQMKVDDNLVHEFLPSTQLSHGNVTLRKEDTHPTYTFQARRDSGNFTAGTDMARINFQARDSVVTSDTILAGWIIEADNTFAANDKKTRMKWQVYTGSALENVLLLDSDKSANFYGNIELAATKRIAFADSKIKIGSNDTPGAQGIQIGYAATASGAQAIAFGYDSNATGNQSIAMGYNSTASGIYSQAYGYNVSATGTGTVVFGTSGSHSDADTLVASGLDLKVTGTGTSTFAGDISIGGTHTATSQVHIKNTSGDNRGLIVENTVAASYAELAIKSDTREFRLGTGGSGVSANATNLFYIYDATTGGTAGHRFEISSAGDVQARRTRSNTAGEVALSLQPTDSTIHYGFRIDQATNSFNLDRVDSAGQLLRVDASGNATFASGTITANGHSVWHAGNDGSGSGLDADFLDGIQGSQFLRSDADDTATGIINFTKKAHDYDTIPPNQNLLDLASIKIAGRNDIYGNATKTVITDYVAKYVNDNTGETTIRLYVDDNILVDGDTYMVSVYYENLIGALSVDFADTAITGNGTQTGTSSAPKSGRIYGYASRADYTSTYRFVDINLTQGSGHEVTLHSPKVEAGTTLTDFVATERTDMLTNSMHVRELTVTSDATFAGTVGMPNGYATSKFAVKSSAVHASFDFYNDGTTYLNGTTTVDADLKVSGSGEDTFIIGPQTAGSGTILMSLNAAENAYEPLRLDVETFKVTASGGTSPCIIETSGLNTTFGGNVSVNDAGQKAVLHVKNEGNNWEDGVLLEHDSGNTGWNIHPENNSDNALWFGYNSDTSVALTSQAATAALKLNSDLSANFGGNVILGDDKNLDFGAVTDFRIVHNSTTNVNHISSKLDRQLSLNANNILLTNQANDSTFLHLSSTGATFIGDINTSGDVHIDEGSTSSFQTTNKLRFGHTSWNNNVGIESYWMVLGCNQNEGFKFRDSSSNMLLQLQGGNNSAGNGAFSATFKGSINVNTNGLINFESNTDIDTGTEVVAQVSKSTYAAAFFDFVIQKGTNVRAGVVYACHDGSTGVEYAETSTVDLGDTTDVTLSVDLGSSTMRLLATTTSNDWSVKSLIRAI